MGEDKTPEHLEFMNHVVGAYKLTRVTTSDTEPCTYQSRSRPHFSSLPEWSDDPEGQDVAVFVDPDIQPVHFCPKSR